MATLDEFIQNLNKFPKIREFGVKSNYKPNTDHNNVIYFATDENLIYLNGKSYGKDFSLAIEELLNNTYTKEEINNLNLENKEIYSGTYSNYDPEETHKDKLYVATDLKLIYFNGIAQSHSEIPILQWNGFLTESNEIETIPESFKKDFIVAFTNTSSYKRTYYPSPIIYLYTTTRGSHSEIIFRCTGGIDNYSGNIRYKSEYKTLDVSYNKDKEVTSIRMFDGGFLSNLATKEEIPTKLSELTNDSNFITSSSLESYYTKSETLEQVNNSIKKVVGAAPEALDTLEEIAAKLNEDSDAINAINGVLTGKVDKVTGKGLSTNDFTNTYKNKLSATPTFWTGTQALYDAISTKDNNTIYLIPE